MPRAPRQAHLRGVFLASLAVTLLSASVGRSSPTPPERLIDASGFGGLRELTSVPPDALQKKLPRGWRVKLCAGHDDGEGSYGFYPELCLSRARFKASFQVSLSDGTQWTRSSYFRTADGLGVGDTLKAWVAKRKQLRCASGDGLVWTTFGEGWGRVHCPKGLDAYPPDGGCMPYANHDCHVASIHLLAPDAKPQSTVKAPPWHKTPRWRKRITAMLKRACASSERCKRDGLCALDSDNHVVLYQCVPATTTHCRRNSACRESGKCTYRDGRCALATTGDCRRSDLCKDEKKCFFKGAECVTREATLTVEQRARPLLAKCRRHVRKIQGYKRKFRAAARARRHDRVDNLRAHMQVELDALGETAQTLDALFGKMQEEGASRKGLMRFAARFRSACRVAR
jgi:hypothetical protein